MTTLFDRVAVTSIDALIDQLGIDPKQRTFCYQYLANKLRGAWNQEANHDPAIRNVADRLVQINIRHRDAVPEEFAMMPGVVIIEDPNMPTTCFLTVYSRMFEKEEKL